MPVPIPLIVFEDKVDSPELTAYFSAFGVTGYVQASDINAMKNGVNELAELVNSHVSGATAAWGNISGSISAQSDLVTAFSFKFDKSNVQNDLTPDITGYKVPNINAIRNGKFIFRGSDSTVVLNNMSAMSAAEFNALTATNEETVYFIDRIKENIWFSSLDDVNTQALTANVQNTISFAGNTEGDGGVALVNISTAVITPPNVSDFLLIKFRFTVVTPTTAGQYLRVILKYGSIIAESTAPMFMNRASGTDDMMTVTFPVAVSTDFKTSGGTLYIEPSTAVTIKLRKITVSRISKATSATL